MILLLFLRMAIIMELFDLDILDAVFENNIDKLIARIIAFVRDFIKALQLSLIHI